MERLRDSGVAAVKKPSGLYKWTPIPILSRADEIWSDHFLIGFIQKTYVSDYLRYRSVKSMGWLSRHLAIAKGIGEFRFKRWLDKNASSVLAEVGVTAGQVVLDFGCGSGTYTIPAANLVGEDGRVYALDVSNRALDKLERKAEQEDLKTIIRIDLSGEEGIPLEDETIDHVLLIDVLQEIDDRETLLEEIYRILKPDGIVTVYPMHMELDEVENLATSKGLTLKDRKFQERIQIFKKASMSGSRELTNHD